jgi:Zn-dependent protease with chaperone function
LVSVFIASLATLQFGMLCWGMAHPSAHWLIRHVLLGTVIIVAALGVGAWELRQTHKYADTLRQLGITRTSDLPGINIVEVPTALAFCLGVIRPEIYVSRGLIERLSAKQLQAVLNHETYHQRRFDPLRILLIDMPATPLFFLPAVQEWRKILRARLELKADAYAVSQSGRAALAGALHTLLSEAMLPLP